jgi:hypothetical protein
MNPARRWRWSGPDSRGLHSGPGAAAVRGRRDHFNDAFPPAPTQTAPRAGTPAGIGSSQDALVNRWPTSTPPNRVDRGAEVRGRHGDLRPRATNGVVVIRTKRGPWGATFQPQPERGIATPTATTLASTTGPDPQPLRQRATAEDVLNCSTPVARSRGRGLSRGIYDKAPVRR